MTRAFLLFAAVLGSLVAASARADADSVGTLQVNGTLHVKFDHDNCPAGSPVTTSCYRSVSVGPEFVAGLGEVTTAYTLAQDGFGSACGLVHAAIPVVVAGKGEIDLVMKSVGCITPDDPARFPRIEVTVSGGSGSYAGASGGGVFDYKNVEDGTAIGSGHSNIAWTGTLNVAGLAFDATPPQIVGAKSKVVKTRAAAGTNVRYSVTALDATDGPLTAACLPKSGSVFAVGRTYVNCSAVDNSGNTATARFVIAVKRVQR
jgi:hypothetical protein